MKNTLLTLLILIVSIISYGQPFGNAVTFDGVNDYIEIPDNSNLNQTSTISVEAWVNPCDVTGTHVILNKSWCAGFQNAYVFSIVDGVLRWTWDTDGCGNGSSYYDSDIAIVQPYVWQHLAAVHTVSGVTLYLNGSPVNGSLTSGAYSNIQSSNDPLRIGVNKGLSGNIWAHFSGSIDEVRIWNYDLSASEILSRYNSALGGNETGLIAYYNMDVTAVGAGLNVPNSSTNTSNIDGTTIGTNLSPVFQAANLCSGVGIFEPNSKRSLEVFPNPSSGFVTISAEGLHWKNVTISFYNTLGQLVLEEEVNSINKNEQTIDVSSLISGVYQLEVLEGERRYSAKVLVD